MWIYLISFFLLHFLALCKANVWEIEGYNICYGSRGSKYGTLQLTREGFLVAIKMEHVSGFITCNRGKSDYYNSYWGCNAGGDQDISNEHIGTYVTDDKNIVILPSKTDKEGYYDQAYYKIPGYKGDCKELVLSSYCTPMYARKGQTIRIWFGEDLYKGTGGYDVEDNGGLHCVNVFVKYLR